MSLVKRLMITHIDTSRHRHCPYSRIKTSQCRFGMILLRFYTWCHNHKDQITVDIVLYIIFLRDVPQISDKSIFLMTL